MLDRTYLMLNWLAALDGWKMATLVVGISTVIVANFAGYVAYQQYRLGREKFKLDVFDKRFAVFAGARLFLTQILQDGRLKDLGPLWAYRAAIGEASFLFDEGLVEYLEEIYKRAVALHTNEETMRSLPVNTDERSQLSALISEDLSWLTAQLPELTKQFGRYLKFKTWR